MFQEVGIFNAKVGLSELPHAIQEEGQRYTITIRGESVADLVPSGATKQRDVHAAVAAMRAFQKIRGVERQKIEEWVREGWRAA
jgi:antitoxin (DNA-binding transcriptional repressor) of toxin-antitoxin stability system